MPMSFPDIESLKFAAKVHKFRKMTANETEEEYREALANHVSPIDFIESHEIRTGRGWDQWNEAEKLEMIARKL